MPVALLMPALSPTMTEGNIAKWIKKVGDEVVSGDILAEVETDKATMEVEAIDEGKLANIIFPDGTENIPVNKLIGIIALEGETDHDVKKFLDENINTTAKKESTLKDTDNKSIIGKFDVKFENLHETVSSTASQIHKDNQELKSDLDKRVNLLENNSIKQIDDLENELSKNLDTNEKAIDTIKSGLEKIIDENKKQSLDKIQLVDRNIAEKFDVIIMNDNIEKSKSIY